MKTSTFLMGAALLGATPILLSNTERGEKIAFAVAEGTTVTKSITATMTAQLDDMQMLMNGEESPMMPSMEMDMDLVTRVKVSDTYGKLSEGRPASLTRKFEDIGMEMDMTMSMEMMGNVEEIPTTLEGGSTLEDKSVTFTWDEDEGAYVKKFVGDEKADEELLEPLTEDMSFRCLLPKEEVVEGDSWEIEVSQLKDLFAPGGQLAMELELNDEMLTMGPGPDPEMFADMSYWFDDGLEGEATGKLTGVREEDGQRIAVIELVLEFDATADMTSLVEEAMEEQDMPIEMEIDISRMDMEMAYEGKGTLLWNLSAGHIAGLNLTGEMAMAMDMGMDMAGGGMEMSMETSMEMSGEFGHEVAVD